MPQIRAALLSLFFAGTAFAQTDTFKIITEVTNPTRGAGATSGPLAQDTAGNLYGTTYQGGDPVCNCGVIYKINPETGAETVLHTFTGGADGQYPVTGITIDSAGNLYGTTSGENLGSDGIVYKLTPDGSFAVLKAFDGVNDPASGFDPCAGVVFDKAGNLYGVTSEGGSTAGNSEVCFGIGCGAAFKIDSSGNYSVLYSFQGEPGDAQFPSFTLAIDSSGNLYGTASQGGADYQGALFEISPAGVETILYSFTGGTDGESPESTPVIDASGNLYGTAIRNLSQDPGGAIWKYDPVSGLSVLTDFGSGSEYGRYPSGKLTLDPNTGRLYGTAAYGGTGTSCKFNCGVIFELLPGASLPKVLHNFTGGSQGAYPYSPLVGRVLPNGSYRLFGTATTNTAVDGGPFAVYSLSSPAH